MDEMKELKVVPLELYEFMHHSHMRDFHRHMRFSWGMLMILIVPVEILIVTSAVTNLIEGDVFLVFWNVFFFLLNLWNGVRAVKKRREAHRNMNNEEKLANEAKEKLDALLQG